MCTVLRYSLLVGRIELREETVETLLGTACLLQLNEVIEACCAFLKKQLHPSNCIGICLFADIQGCISLRTAAHNYTTVNIPEDFKDISLDGTYKIRRPGIKP